MKLDLRAVTLEEIRNVVQSKGEPLFRGKQIYDWILKGVSSIDQIGGIPQVLKAKLEEDCYISIIEILEKQKSKLDDTCKYLLCLDDDNIIESVAMKYKHGTTLCVSTQVGCKMGCKFCSSTLNGLERNLTSGEMMGQVLTVQKDLQEKITHIVLMGSGEPLENYNEVIKFIHLLHEEKGLNISYRRITLSTCGIVPGIRALAKENIPINLSLSLHHVNQDERKAMMPISIKYPLEEVIHETKAYGVKTGRRITYEYALIKGINDTKEQAKKLANLLRGSLAHVNLIPINPGGSAEYSRPSDEMISIFSKVLKDHGIEATVRRELGTDILGACGQLRHRKLKEGGVNGVQHADGYGIKEKE